MAFGGPPPGAWPEDLVLSCKYDPAVVSILARTEVELASEHRKLVAPTLLRPDGSHPVTYAARPVRVAKEKPKQRKRKPDDDDGDVYEMKLPCGRYIAQDTSPQTLPSWVRRLTCYRFNHEIDQVNSCASIMWWMAATVKIERGCPHLRRYLTERVEVLDEIMEARSITYNEAKQRVTSILFGCRLDDATVWEDNLWHEGDVLMRTVLGHDEFRDKAAKFADLFEMHEQELNERQLFARLVQEKEREIMQVVIRTLTDAGYTVSALIHDSVLVQRAQPLAELDFARRIMPDDEPFENIAMLDKAIAAHCGLFVKMQEKSMRPTDEDVQKLLTLPRDCFTAYEAALEASFHCTHFLRHSKEGIAMYDSYNNIWEMRENELLNIVMPRLFAPFAHRLTAKAQGHKKPVHFLNDRPAAKNMFACLCTVVVKDEQWKERAIRNGRGNLCFRNGYWDFSARTFVHGACPEMEFLIGVRDTFRMPTEDEIAAARDFIRAPYSHDSVFQFYMIALARGLAGEVSAKQGYICIGPSNSGKSTITGALVSAFPSVVETFDPSNLCNVGGDGDRARDMAWVIPLEFALIGLGCEVDMVARRGGQRKLNMIQWKVLISGGLDDVPQRLLYKEARSTKINTTFFVHANDVPPFSAVDQAVINRTHVVLQDRKAVREPRADNEFKMIDGGDAYVRTDEFKAGLRGLLFQAHELFTRVGHEPPKEVRLSTQDRVEMTNPMEQLGEIFEIWSPELARSFLGNAAAKAAGWCLPRQRLVDAITTKQLGMSPAAVIATLRENGTIREVRHDIGKVFIGIRLKIAGDGVGQRD